MIVRPAGYIPIFIDRGDPANVDWALEDFTADGAWHDLDLTSVVPAGASAVAFACVIFNTIEGKTIAFRTNGNSNSCNTSLVSNVAVGVISQDIIIAPDANGVIEYNTTAGGWLSLNLSVKGWWR